MNGPIAFLKEASPYIRLYRNKTFVIKLGGAILTCEESRRAIAEQCALLVDLGIRVVLVHGGGPQASALTRRLGGEPRLVAGRRITDDLALEAVKMVFAGQLNVDLLSALREVGALPIGLSGIDAGLILAVRRPPVQITDDQGLEREVDFGHVGDICRVNAAVLDDLLDRRYLPVIAHRNGFRVAEIPVRHRPRRHGVSKFGMTRFTRGAFDLLTITFLTRYRMRPLHLFGLLGLTTFGAGSVILVVLAYQRLVQHIYLSNRPLLFLGVLLIIVGIQFFSIGLLGEMITSQRTESDAFLIKKCLGCQSSLPQQLPASFSIT